MDASLGPGRTWGKFQMRRWRSSTAVLVGLFALLNTIGQLVFFRPYLNNEIDGYPVDSPGPHI